MITLLLILDTLIFKPVTIYPMRDYNKTILKSGNNTIILKDTVNYQFTDSFKLIKL